MADDQGFTAALRANAPWFFAVLGLLGSSFIFVARNMSRLSVLEGRVEAVEKGMARRQVTEDNLYAMIHQIERDNADRFTQILAEVSAITTVIASKKETRRMNK